MRRLLFILFILFSTTAIAQYKQHQPFKDYYTARAIGGERVYQRIYLGGGKHFIFGTADLHYKGYDTSGNAIDTNLSVRIRSKQSYLIHAGTYFPFVLLSDNSALAFNFEVLGSFSYLTLDSVFFHPKALYKKSEPIIMLGIPVSLDFKTDGDVSLSKVRKTMFTIGGGFLIGGTNRYFTSSAQVPISPIPFTKLEAGYFAGLAIKLHAKIYFGDGKFIDRPTGNIFGNDELYTKTHSGFGYNISLVLMPFSYGWRTEEWY